MEVDGGAATANAEVEGPAVMTVAGPLPPQQVSGPSLCSEHLLFDFSPFVPAATDHGPMRMAPVSLAVLGHLKEDPFGSLDNCVMKTETSAEEELRAFASQGGSLVVDTTVTALGRNPRALRRLAQATGIHIVMGCGYFRSPTHPTHLAGETAEQVAKALELELVGGAVDSDADARIFPGVIGAIGLSAQPDDAEKKVLFGAAMAQARTGAPLFIDVLCCVRDGSAVLDMVQSRGGDVKKTVLLGIGAACEEQEYLLGLLRRGCWLALDCVGCGNYLPEFDLQLPADDRIATCVERLVTAGFAGQLLISGGHFLKMHRQAHGGVGMGHVPGRFIRRLKRHGLGADVIERLLVHNLRELLAYYIPREVEAAPEETWACDNCEKAFPESKEKFNKFDFNFCSIKCLQAGRKKTNNWTAPLK